MVAVDGGHRMDQTGGRELYPTQVVGASPTLLAPVWIRREESTPANPTLLTPNGWGVIDRH